MVIRTGVLDYLYPHTNGAIRTEYSPYAIHQAKKIAKNGIDDQAVKRKFEEGITIDGIESLDLDDGIWAERTSNGYAVFVSISDVTEAIPIFSPIDIEAMKRTTSIYLRDRVLNMIPEVLSQDILSLNENGKKLTLTMKIELDSNGEFRNFNVYESVFTNRKRYHYDSFHDDFINPDSENHKLLHLMYEIALKRKEFRKNNGADSSFDDSDRQLEISKNTNVQSGAGKAIASTIISEFMIMANIAASLISVKNGLNSVFRIQKEIGENAFYSSSCNPHVSLALGEYTHFTSPIRRFADMILHRVLKLVYIRGEKEPYNKQNLSDLLKHINVSRAVIGVLSKGLSNELKAEEVVSKIKGKNGGNVSVADLKISIRNNISEKRKIPKAILREIIKDLEGGKKSNWVWAIGIFLISGNKDIINVLRKITFEEKRLDLKGIISILNNTVITRGDKEKIFEITEEENLNQLTITVKFRGEKLFSCSKNYTEKNPYSEVLGELRKKIIEKIFIHFGGK